MTTRFMQIDSTYRDRNRFPNPCQFSITVGSKPTLTNGVGAVDPVCDAYPWYPPAGTYQNFVAGSTSVLQLSAAGSADTVNNYYVGSLVCDINTGEYSTVTGYTQSNQSITIDPPFANPGTSNHYYNFRRSRPVITGAGNGFVDPPGNTIPAPGAVLVDGSLTTVTLPVTGTSSVNDYYKGMYVYITGAPDAGSIPAIGQFRLINAYEPMDPITGLPINGWVYDGTTRVAKVTPPFDVAPVAGCTFEIIQFSRDNYCPLNFVGFNTPNNTEVCYEITLLKLTLPILPTIPTYNRTGNRVQFNSYVYVELSSPTPTNLNMICSNNPNATKALFIVPAADIPWLGDSGFVHNDAELMTQTIKFKPGDELTFTVYLPNKQILNFAPDDTLSPLAPDPNRQVNAIFSIKNYNLK